MAVRVTTLKGAEAGEYYTRELGRYYLDAGEPPGAWFGAQAEALGLTGELDSSHFLALMAGRLPISGTVLGRVYGGTSARGYDVTFNAPKSVSVLWAFGDTSIQRDVLDAHDEAVTAVLSWLEDRAHTRITHDKTTFVVDTQGLAVGLFEQHTSRTGDPHLHTHAVVIAKVRDESGRWLALDARMLLKDQRTLSALYHACLRAELTRRLGVQWETPVNGIAEIVGIDDIVFARFSSRTEQFEERFQDKLDRFRITFDREPTDRERWRLEREAARDSRPGKDASATGSALSAKWRDELARLGIEPDELTRNTIGRQLEAAGLDFRDAERIATQARTELVENVSTWRMNDVVREIARRVPSNVTTSPAVLVKWIDDTATGLARNDVELAPRSPLNTSIRRDGRPVTESDLDRRFTTNEILAQEELIATWALGRLDSHGERVEVERGDLDRAQHAAAQAVAGGAPLVLIVGPAGAGKTASLRAAVRRLHQGGRPVFGLAPSATAAAVLQERTGARADTLDKLLHDYRQGRKPLPVRTTIVVDEAGMVSTPRLAELVQLADAHRWRVVLIGDPRQLPAVGRGGMFAHLVAIGDVHELDRVHRFAHPWERAASLALRRGETEAIEVYESHHRLCDGTPTDMQRAALAAWAEHRAKGDDVALLAVSNETVTALNVLAQRHRMLHGELDLSTWVTARGYSIHVGDEIATRTNDRELRTSRGAMVRNRARWTVTRIHRNGDVEVSGPDGTITLPSSYVTSSVELAYSQTIHGAQGRTVDHSLLLVDGPIDGRGLYVGMTRGAQSNTAYVAVDGNRTARDVLENAIGGDWADAPAIEVRLGLRQGEPAARPLTTAERLGAIGRRPLPRLDRGL